MILSMTGYGKSEKQNKNFLVNIEIKSINNRFFDPILKIHPNFKGYEQEIVSLVKKECVRGRVFLNIDVDVNKHVKQFKLNSIKLKSYLSIIDEISQKSKIEDSISLSDLLKYPDLIESINLNEDLKNKKLLFSALKSAIRDFKNFRKNEGENLLLDIEDLINKNDKIFKKIKSISINDTQKQLREYKKKIKYYMPNLSKLDDDRLYQEIAIILEKKDINEEIIRLDSHLKLFITFLNSKKNEGKKKNFLLQEMIREVNTIGAKSDNVKIRHLVVDVKDNLEKIREQVQNIL